jgi:hypothetical protein
VKRRIAASLSLPVIFLIFADCHLRREFWNRLRKILIFGIRTLLADLAVFVASVRKRRLAGLATGIGAQIRSQKGVERASETALC